MQYHFLDRQKQKQNEINGGVTDTLAVTGSLADATTAKEIYDNILQQTADEKVYAVKISCCCKWI